jgi:hypothetical protein
VAIGNDTAIGDVGRLTLRNVRTRGQVLLLADSAVRRGHVEVDGLAVAAADLRGRTVSGWTLPRQFLTLSSIRGSWIGSETPDKHPGRRQRPENLRAWPSA